MWSALHLRGRVADRFARLASFSGHDFILNIWEKSVGERTDRPGNFVGHPWESAVNGRLNPVFAIRRHGPCRGRQQTTHRAAGTKALSQVPELFRFGVHVLGDEGLAEDFHQVLPARRKLWLGPRAGAGLAVHDGSHDGLRHRPASLLPAVPAVRDFQLPPHLNALLDVFAVRRPHHR